MEKEERKEEYGAVRRYRGRRWGERVKTRKPSRTGANRNRGRKKEGKGGKEIWKKKRRSKGKRKKE